MFVLRESSYFLGPYMRYLTRRTGNSDNQQLSVLRSQHKDECKGLIVQIRYLKAKYTRESTMRSDLCNQKRYLIVLLARCERK